MTIRDIRTVDIEDMTAEEIEFCEQWAQECWEAAAPQAGGDPVEDAKAMEEWDAIEF
jgi:hypothetical protein